MNSIITLILSAVLFVWELFDLRSDIFLSRGSHNEYQAVLLYVRMIFVLICLPALWGIRLLKWLGWLPSSDLESPNVLQMRMFAWTLNAVLTVVFVLRIVAVIF